jgi:hypothetical protein
MRAHHHGHGNYLFNHDVASLNGRQDIAIEHQRYVPQLLGLNGSDQSAPLWPRLA